jgi:hypothetical protein
MYIFWYIGTNFVQFSSHTVHKRRGSDNFARVVQVGFDKRTSLQHCRINHNRKKFYSTDPYEA